VESARERRAGRHRRDEVVLEALREQEGLHYLRLPEAKDARGGAAEQHGRVART